MTLVRRRSHSAVVVPNRPRAICRRTRSAHQGVEGRWSGDRRGHQAAAAGAYVAATSLITAMFFAGPLASPSRIERGPGQGRGALAQRAPAARRRPRSGVGHQTPEQSVGCRSVRRHHHRPGRDALARPRAPRPPGGGDRGPRGEPNRAGGWRGSWAGTAPMPPAGTPVPPAPRACAGSRRSAGWTARARDPAVSRRRAAARTNGSCAR